MATPRRSGKAAASKAGRRGKAKVLAPVLPAPAAPAAPAAKAAKPGQARSKAAAAAKPAKVVKSAKAAPSGKRGKRGKLSKAGKRGNPARAAAVISLSPAGKGEVNQDAVVGPLIEVRRIHRRDINRVWEFLKISFRDVNSETVEYQRPRSKHRFEEIYEEEGVQQLLFEVDGDIVAYAECTYEVTGSDNWINPRYFEKRDMRPMFIDELAVHPDWHGRGVGSFVLEQLHHLARVNGLTHLVLEVAENNENALAWYKKRSFRKLDAAIFMACALDLEPELLPPRALPVSSSAEESHDNVSEE